MNLGLDVEQCLDEHLVLRTVESDGDAKKVIAINDQIHGGDVGSVLRHWFFEGHPILSRGDWLFVEDRTSGEAVATLSFMPLMWRYGCQPLPVAELGFVATLPDYRRKGLQCLLSSAFDQLALSHGHTLAAIEGIPGFYAQFGYEYALPLGGGVHLEFQQVPEEVEPTRYTARPATAGDVPALQVLYDATIAGLDVAAPRSAELWTYQLAVPEEVTFYGFTTVIEEKGTVVGYLRWSDDNWSDRLRVVELAVEDGPAARERILVALDSARNAGRSGGKCGLKLELPHDHPAVTVARYLGAVEQRNYGWQMKVLDPTGFMQCIGPTLEARLEASVLAGHSGSLVFDLYRSRLALGFEAGKLVEVKTLTRGKDDVRPDARMTLKQATQLWLGWRGRKALEGWNPDFWSREQVRHLIDVLFPPTRAHIYMAY